MKVAVVCDSVLLRRSLEIFLRDRLSDFSTADVIISDRRFECDKPLLLVSNDPEADIKKPFGKAKLLSLLDNFEKDLVIQKEIFEPKSDDITGDSFEKGTLEEQIAKLTQEFSARLAEIIRATK